MKRTTKSKKGTLDYPVSVKYRETWGEWEAVREIVQNALDSRAKVKVDFKDGKMTVRDWGAGFGLKALLIGESDKDGQDTIGKFGEGMKFGFLVLLRLGCKVKVRTNGLSLTPKLVDTFGTDCLSIDYQEEDEAIEGTSVVIDGLEQDYKDRFLHLSKKGKTSGFKTGVSKVLLDKPRKLYIKGIYVKDLPDAVAGYDLWLERENPMSGDVDMYAVRRKVGYLISQTKDKEYIARLVALVDRDDYDDFIEVEADQQYSVERPRLWSNAIKNHFGTAKVCKLSHLDAGRLAEYKGYTVIKKEIPYLDVVLKLDTDVVTMKTRDPQKKIRKSDMVSEAQANVRWARRLVENATDSRIKKLFVVKFIEKPSQRGEALYQDWIKISEAIVLDREQLLATMIHEMVHYLYGHDDLTHAFQDAVAKIAAKVAIMAASGKGKGGSTRVYRGSKEWKARRAEEDAKADDIRAEWLVTAERSNTGQGGNLWDHLDVHNKKDLYPIARAFNVKTAFGMTKEDLIHDLRAAILKVAADMDR